MGRIVAGPRVHGARNFSRGGAKRMAQLPPFDPAVLAGIEERLVLV
jgi:hypothetical protein